MTYIHKTELDYLRERIDAERACMPPSGSDFPVAVSIDGSPLVYGTYHWEQEEPELTRFGQGDWRECVSGLKWRIEAEIHLPTFGAMHELRWGEVDEQLYSGSAYHNSTRAERYDKIRTLFKGCGPITREDRR